MNTVRKNISIPITSYKTINNYAKKIGMSFSEFLRYSAFEVIIKNEKLDLLGYINANCSYLSVDEQKEIEALKIDFDDLSGKELTLDELLQG